MTDATDFCPHQLVMDLLRGSYDETGVMDFGLKLKPPSQAYFDYSVLFVCLVNEDKDKCYCCPACLVPA